MSENLLGKVNDQFFGVQAMLKPGAKIVFESLFNLRHIGRVIDLVIHESKDFFEKCAEGEREQKIAKVRQTLELAILGAWVNYRSSESTKTLELEVGWDDERLIVSVAGFVADDLGNFIPSAGPVESESSQRYSRYGALIDEHSSEVIVRHHDGIGYLQIFIVHDVIDAAAKKKAQYVTLLTSATPLTATAPNKLSELPDRQPLSGGKVEEFLSDERLDSAVREKTRAQVADGQDGPVTAEAKRRAAGESPQSISAPEVDPGEISIAGENSEPDSGKVTVSGGDENADSTETTVSGESFEEDQTETLVSGSDADDGNTTTTVKGKAEVADKTKTTVKGKTEGVDKTKTTVKGKTPGADNSKTVVSGSPEDVDNTETVVSGDDQAADDAVTKLAGDGDIGVDQTITRVKGGKSANADEKVVLAGEALANSTEEDDYVVLGGGLDNVGGKAASGKQSEPEKAELLTKEAAEILAIDTDDSKVGVKDVGEVVVKMQTVSKSTEEATVTAEIILEKTGKDFGSQIDRVQKVVEKVEIPERLKEYFSKALQDLTKNRAELEEQMKQVNTRWRAAQLEFKNQQGILENELKKRDALVKQKTAAIEKSKEVLARTVRAMEDYKEKAAATSDAESAHRIAQANSIANRAKEHAEKLQSRVDEAQKKLSAETASRAALGIENTKLQRSVEDLQRKLADAEKAKGVKTVDPQMVADLDRANKQVEELKKQNKQLQEKLTQATSTKQSPAAAAKSGGKGDKDGDQLSEQELKHKLEVAQKMNKTIKDDLDKAVKRLDEAKQSETKLRIEITKLQAELKAAQKGAKKAG